MFHRNSIWDELARVAKKYDLYVRVTGAGWTVLQGHPASRFIEPVKSGLYRFGTETARHSCRKDHKISRGGIADHLPTEANRRHES